MTDYHKTAAKKKAKTAPAQPKPDGFGFQPERSQHHFMVTLPVGKDENVFLSEHFHYDDAEARRELNLALGKEDDKLRCVLPLAKWEAVAEAIKSEFNELLKSPGLAAGRWGKRQTPVSRLLGKEMLLLDLESRGEFRSSAYQELACGFGLRDYTALLGNDKANEVRLLTASEFGKKLRRAGE